MEATRGWTAVRRGAAWGGTCGPFSLLIRPGRGEEGAAARRPAIWPRPGNWVVRCGRRCQYGSIRAVCQQMFIGVFALQRGSGGKTCLSVAGGLQTLTLRLPHVNRRLLKPGETPSAAPVWLQMDKNGTNARHWVY